MGDGGSMEMGQISQLLLGYTLSLAEFPYPEAKFNDKSTFLHHINGEDRAYVTDRLQTTSNHTIRHIYY